MAYSFNASKNPEYVLNCDVDSDSNRFDCFKMQYKGKEYNIFAKDCDNARKQAEKILKKLKLQ